MDKSHPHFEEANQCPRSTGAKIRPPYLAPSHIITPNILGFPAWTVLPELSIWAKIHSVTHENCADSHLPQAYNEREQGAWLLT